MKKIAVLIVLSLAGFIANAQKLFDPADLNPGFEKTSAGKSLPDEWFVWGKGFDIGLDSAEVHSGKYAIHISPKQSDATFGCIAYGIPANFMGKRIELRAWMKMQDVHDGVIGLLLRIDGPSGTLQFTNMMNEKVAGSSNWKQYSVSLPYPPNGKTIYIGGMLAGKGDIWVDDFEVLIDGKKIENLKQRVVQMTKGETDTAFNRGSGLTAENLNRIGTDNLVLLGKIWGFLKYYHPAVAHGDYNWDFELFRILTKMQAATGTESRNKILLDWVESLGEVKKGKQLKFTGPDVKMAPDLAFIDHTTLGEELAAKLVKIRDAKCPKENYYIGLVYPVNNPEFKNERSYWSAKYPDAGFRLLCLYRYWNMIQYYFPYKYLIKENWNDVLKEFVPQMLSASNELEYKLATLALIARVHDTHANIWGSDSTLIRYKGVNYAPVQITFVENKAVVTDYLDDTAGPRTGLKKGDVITKINGKPVEEILPGMLPYTPASNHPTQLRDMAHDLLRSNDTLLNIDYERNNQTNNTNIQCLPGNKINVYKSYTSHDTCFRMVNDHIACLYPGTIKGDYLPALMKIATSAKGLIIDFRCYPSDFIVFSLSEYLLPSSTPFVKFSSGSVSAPGLFTFSEPLSAGKNNPNYYKGKVVIIVNENTQSSAEYHSMAFRTAPQAVVIGSTTAAADGNVSNIHLPGGISTMISGLGIYYPDGTETQRIGIVPDIDIKPTIKGIREGRDELLEKAIQIIEQQ